MALVSSWGNLEHSCQEVVGLSDRFSVSKVFQNLNSNFIPRGNGRSYGDVCTNSNGKLLWTAFLNHFIDFDPLKETVTVEAGMSLKILQRFLVPRGFMLPVTPGTQEITVGGAIANDVHCKNHHMYGTFGHHVKAFSLCRSSGEVLYCTPEENAGYFSATIGGLGLTGLITEATLKLKRIKGSWINAENVPYGNLNEFFELAKKSEDKYEHTVAWIDCITGKGDRGIFMRGNNSDRDDYVDPKDGFAIPFTPPFSLVNSLSLRIFNKLYYWRQQLQSKPFWVHYEKFFYPLDGIRQWNRIYGPKGFYQYQCVVPYSDGLDAISEIQTQIASAGCGSFLGVLKTFGKKDAAGMLSFPMEGFTYALDFPNKGKSTVKLFQRLDSVVRNAHGRLYLAKDARQSVEMFEAGYGEKLEEFLKYVDPMCSSDMSRRLMGV